MTASVDDHRILVPREVTGAVVVRFDDAYVWSFHPDRDGVKQRDGWSVDWPPGVLPHLSGTTRVRVTAPEADHTWFDATVTFADNPAPLTLQDKKGRALAIDKWGKLTRVFAETGSGLIAELVAGTARVIAELAEHVGVEAHLNYGALLGAVRDGHLIGHDNDADLAYLSRHTHPADIIAESYRMERVMRSLGWKLVRMSAADLKLYFPMSDGSEAHIDVFGAFYVGDTFYLLGDTSGHLPREVISPLGTVVLEGVEVAAPRDPEAMLAFLYGESWRVPDPAFSRTWPADGIQRLDSWLRGQRTHIKDWNRIVAADLPVQRSSFVDWVEARLPEGGGVADVGCGNGRDIQWFARRRPTKAFDYTGTALRRTRRRILAVAGPEAPEPDVYPLPLNDFRAVAIAGADLARTAVPHHVYARHLLGCLDDDARRNLWRLVSMATRRGSSLSLEFLATATDAPAEPDGLLRRLDAGAIADEVRALGFESVELEVGPGENVFDHPDPRVARLHARRPHREEHR